MFQLWLEDQAASAIPVLDEAAVSRVRETVRQVGGSIRMDGERLERLVTAASEIAHNQRLHAGGGMTVVRRCDRGGVPGVEVVAADRGPGLADPAAAFAGLGKSEGSLGIGVSSAHRLVDELDVDVRVGHGTCFWLRKFVTPIPRGIQVGVWARAKVGERVNGDDGGFIRRERELLLMVADGLGHGNDARSSSLEACTVVRKDPSRSLEDHLLAADTALRGKRGAAVTLTRVDDAAATVECAAVGNVVCSVDTRTQTSKFGAESWTIGIPTARRKIRPERRAMPANGAILLYSDGVSGRANLTDHPALFLEHPVVAAHFIATTFGRTNDDLMVVVAR